MGHILKYIYLEPEAYYDLIAGEYDSRTATKMCRAENEVLFEELGVAPSLMRGVARGWHWITAIFTREVIQVLIYRIAC